MKNYRVNSVKKHYNHLVLTLAPETEHDILQFLPGQYATIAYKKGGSLSPMRCFSITSSPHSAQLQFAMRVKGNFTQQIAQLQSGDQMKVQGPFGEFVSDPRDTSVVMLAAGIGITPFMSMLRHAAESQDPTPRTLLYACRSTQDIPFRAELDAIQQQNRAIKVAYIVDQGISDSSQNIFVGKINDVLLQKVTNNSFRTFTYFICGPKQFTKAMSSILAGRKVNQEQVITESFTQATTFSWNPFKLNIASLTYALAALTLLAGVGAVMAIDLVRYVPKALAANKADSTTKSTNTTTTGSQAATETSNEQSSSNSSSTTTPSTTSQTTQTYQAPVSSVS